MQVLPSMPFNLSLELAKLVMILVIYAPYAVMNRPMPAQHPAIAVAGFGLALMLSLVLRNLVVREKAPLWSRTLWASGDLLLWGLSARYTNWHMPVTVAGFMLAADLAMVGWRYRRGLWHWAVATVFVSFAPVLFGDPFTLPLLAGYLLPVLPGCLFGYLFLRIVGNMYEAREIAERAKKEAELANIHLREYADQVEQTAVLRERTRMARDIQDTIAHAFTSIHTQLEVLELLVQEEPDEAVTVLAQVKEQVSDSLDEVRRSVHALRPLQLEERRGIDSIRKLVQDFAAATGVGADLRVEGDALELPVAQELCLYRAIQEGLTNAFRHGRAKRARVRLLFAPGSVTASIEDDGLGAKESASTGFGLVGIRERSAALGGTVAAGTAATGGFVLRVTLPLATARTEGAE